MVVEHDIFHPFLRLPPELRQEVYKCHLIQPTYELYLCKSEVRHLIYSHYRLPSRRNPNPATSLLCVSRLVYDEAMPIFYRFHHFDICGIHDDCWLWEFLTAIGPERRRHLRAVTFRYPDSPENVPETFRLLRTAVNLTELYIYMEPNQFYDWLSYEGELCPQDHKGLKELLELRGLRTLEIEVVGTCVDARADIDQLVSHLQVIKEPRTAEYGKLELETAAEETKPRGQLELS